MQWIKKDGSLKTVADVIRKNTGMEPGKFLASAKESSITNAKAAAARMLQAVNNGEPVSIIGDYDADGITSGSILYLTFAFLGVHPKMRFPRRFSEGYGISEKMVDEIDSGLLITVDNGIAAFDCIKKAKEKGLYVIIVDHHLNEDNLPPADIIVNPHTTGDDDFKDYCGAGLSYRICREMLEMSLGEEPGKEKVYGYRAYMRKQKDELVRKLSSLAAVGTVADVVPLLKENRKIVIDGLVNINEGHVTNGMKALMSATKNMQMDEVDIGYSFAPTINAAGRLNDNGAMMVFRLLASESLDEKKLNAVAENLVEINTERKNIVNDALAKVAEKVDPEHLDAGIVVLMPGISEGVIGIIAGKLSEEYKRPAIVFTDGQEDGFLKGSGRSPEGIHLKNILDKCRDVLYKYGGHAGAAGMTVKAVQFDEFRNRFVQEVAKECVNFEHDVSYYDLDIRPEDVDAAYNEVERFRPFGAGNEAILFKILNFEGKNGFTTKYRVLGDSHVKIMGKYNDALAFGLYDQFKPLSEEKSWNLIGDMYENTYNGITSVQIKVKDFA